MPAPIPIAQQKIALLNSGNVCAFPECERALVLPGTNSDPAAAVGEIAHIVAASRQGPRGNVDLDDESRNLAENLIVLCPEHHTTIDAQPRTYSIPVLRQMKADHERRIANVRVRGRQTGAQGHEFVSERLYSTLLPITHIPSVVFAAPSPHGDNEYESIKEQIRSARSRWLLPFLLKDGLLLTFYDLRVRNNPFKPFIRGDVQRFPARELWYDPEGSRRYKTLLNRSMHKFAGRQGVRFDPSHQRYFFEPVEQRLVRELEAQAQELERERARHRSGSRQASLVDGMPLQERTDAGGWRELLAGRPVHAGNTLYLLTSLGWYPIRYETNVPRKISFLYLSLPGVLEDIAIRVPRDARFAWPDELR